MKIALLSLMVLLSGCALMNEAPESLDHSYLVKKKLDSVGEGFYAALLSGRPESVTPGDVFVSNASEAFEVLNRNAHAKYGDGFRLTRQGALYMEGFYFITLITPHDITFHYVAMPKGGSVLFYYDLPVSAF